MRSMKKMLTVLAFLGTMLVAPLASADRYRGVDGRYYDYDRSSYNDGYYDDRRDRRRNYRHSSRNRDVAVAAAILGTAAVIASSNNRNRSYRRSRSHGGYGNWNNYCRNNWRRDPRC